MRKFITIFIFQLLIMPFALNANENFSVEIEALTLVMKEYEKNNINKEKKKDLELINYKASYIALKQDECNAIVKVTEKTGQEIVDTESFDVNICKKEVTKVIN